MNDIMTTVCTSNSINVVINNGNHLFQLRFDETKKNDYLTNEAILFLAAFYVCAWDIYSVVVAKAGSHISGLFYTTTIS